MFALELSGTTGGFSCAPAPSGAVICKSIGGWAFYGLFAWPLLAGYWMVRLYRRISIRPSR